MNAPPKVTRALLLLLAGAPALEAQDPPEQLLEAARYEQQVRGDLEGASRIYHRILTEFSDDPSAALALVELGRLHETLGREDAGEFYRRVLRDYPDERDAAELARARLTGLAQGTGALTADPQLGIVVRQLWSESVGIDVGALSPDGRRIAFVDWGGSWDEALRGHADLAVYDTRTGRARLVTDRPPQTELATYIESPLWSGDGTRLAYALWDTAWTHRALHVIDADGRNPRVLVDNPEFADVRPMAWSEARGFILARLRGWDDVYRVATVSLRDGAVRVIKSVGTHAPAVLSLSPDARFIVYDQLQEEGSTAHDLFLLAVDGSTEVRVAPHPADDEWPVWTGDGGRIVFLSDRSGRRSLWAVPVEAGRATGEPELVRPDVGPISLLGPSGPDGLYYRMSIQVRDVHTAELDWSGPGALDAVGPATDRFVGTNLRADWSPDGNRLAYLSFRGAGGVGQPHVVIRHMETGTEIAHPLPFPVRATEAKPLWSADGRRIRIEGGDPGARSYDPGRRVSYELDVLTGEATRREFLSDAGGRTSGTLHYATDAQAGRLRELGIRLAHQRDSNLFGTGDAPLRPGEELLVVRNGGVARARLPLRDPEDLEYVTPRGHVHAWSLSPDGGTIAVAVSSDPDREVSDVLWLVSLENGGVREVARVREEEEITAIRWTPGSEALLLAVSGLDGDYHGEIRHLPIAAGTSTPLDVAMTPLQLGDMGFHPDGVHITFTTLESRDELWVMEGLPW